MEMCRVHATKITNLGSHEARSCFSDMTH